MKVKIGDIITLGNYRQSDKYGNSTEPIEWKVLDVADGKALIISVKALERVRFNERYADATWADSTLRSWMNGEFAQTAFTAEELDRILVTKVSTADNAKWGTRGGADTEDKIFALSKEELEKYFPVASDRGAKPTEAAKVQGIYTYDENGYCCWWLRTPGYVQYAASRVNVGGGISDTIYDDKRAHRAARPAMWIKTD
ncbi:MAG: DUF6273 domain-containing protein [Lachnospiraceae bacterium]|jgi:hypothetical protein